MSAILQKHAKFAVIEHSLSEFTDSFMTLLG